MSYGFVIKGDFGRSIVLLRLIVEVELGVVRADFSIVERAPNVIVPFVG